MSAGDFTFGPERRIRRRADFLRAQSRGLRVSGTRFVFLVASGQSAQSCSRLGIVVTKKIGHSPARSRIKRLCRECFRLWPDLVPHGIDLVVIARLGAADMDLAMVRAEWARARPALLKRCESLRARPSS